jgi:ABC-2 type transport system permease protein
MLVLAALSAVLGALGVALFVRRDIGAPVALLSGLRFPERPRPTRAVPLDAWSLRSVFARSLRSLTAPTLWWGLVIAAYTALVTAILRQAQQNLADMLKGLAQGGSMTADLVARFTGGGDVAINVMFLNLIFALLAVVVAAFALTLANRWAADEEEGRLELLLGTPQPRHLVILARFGAVTVALLVVAGLILASVALTAAVVGMKLDPNRLAQAAFGMVPVGLVVAAVGYLLSGWLRTAAVTGILIALLLASFIVSSLGPLFNWPEILLQFSIFEQYGAPLMNGLRVSNTLGLLAVAAAALAIATIRFARKDLAR